MNNQRVKEQAFGDYFSQVITKSWTWERLTADERERFATALFNTVKPYGNYHQRMEQAMNVYSVFLDGAGYKPYGWRETTEEKEAPRF